jgi:hypothetical protein
MRYRCSAPRDALAPRATTGHSAPVIGNAFRARFVVSDSGSSAETSSVVADPQLGDVFNALGGVNVDDGLYRVYSARRAMAATAMAQTAMPALQGRIECFGADWLGRHFALDRARRDNGENLVLMLEPGTGEALEIPASVRSFHDTELVDYAEEALAVAFYTAWRESSGDLEPLDDRSCVGYSTPLFLGGTDDVTNLVRSDMEVYWHVMGELRAATQPLAPGTRISSIHVDE